MIFLLLVYPKVDTFRQLSGGTKVPPPPPSVAVSLSRVVTDDEATKNNNKAITPIVLANTAGQPSAYQYIGGLGMMMMSMFDGGEGGGGTAAAAEAQIVILRFKSSNTTMSHWLSVTNSVCAVLCNAMQEPNMVHNGNLRMLGEVFKHYAAEDEPQTRKARAQNVLEDMLNVAVRLGILPGDPLSAAPLLIPSAMSAPPGSKGQRDIKSGEAIYKFWDGIGGADEFESERPPYFFLNYYVMTFGSLPDHRVASVFWKSGQSYICTGTEKSMVYRVHQPKLTFFSRFGHDYLRLCITMSIPGMVPDGSVVSFQKSISASDDGATFHLGGAELGGTSSMYCVPKVFPYDSPENWDGMRYECIIIYIFIFEY